VNRLGLFSRIVLIAALGLFAIFAAIILPHQGSLQASLVIALFLGMSGFMILKLVDLQRFDWAYRIVCGVVFLLYLARLAWAFAHARELPLIAFPGDSWAMVIAGFRILGMPALAYARTGWRQPARGRIS
jgi:hypothetical protein